LAIGSLLRQGYGGQGELLFGVPPLGGYSTGYYTKQPIILLLAPYKITGYYANMYREEELKGADDLEKTVQRFVEKEGLLQGVKRLGVAVSGGADSVALFYLLAPIC
jgi:hypothetical protein